MADPFDDDSLFAATQGTVSAGEAGPTRADPLPTEWEPAHAKAAERGVLLTTLTMEELTEGLNEAQALAVTTTQGPLLVVAGPGSGKTKVLTHRVGALLVEGVPAWRILAVTFTNKASGEMRSRLTTLVGEAGKDLWVSTFHSLCVKLLRRYGSVVGLSASFTILDQDDSLKMVKEATLACGGTKEDGKTMQRLISYAKNNLMNPGDIPGAPGKLFHVAQEYEQRKMRASVVDFDDLLLQLHAALGHEEVASALRAKFSYVLVDEYQDTNRVQYEILRAITSESRNLCVVGDADQSVYAWRGAFPGVLDGFLTDYSEAKVVKLEQNYRSTKKVLEVASAVISPNPTKARADLWTENPEGESIRLVEMGDDRDEAAWVVADLGRTTGTTAVIVRTNSQTKPFEDALMASHRPFQLVGAQRFFDRSEVRDAMAWLRCGLNHGDRLALTRAAGSPKRGLGEKSLRAWFELAEELGVTPTSLGEEELAGLGGRASKGVAAFISDVRSVSDAAGEGPEAALKAVVRLGLLKDMERERAENINQLLASAAEFDFAGRGGFEVSVDFVESVALTGAADAGSEKGDASPLYLITAHAAKGREFDNVYVVGVEDGIYPHAKTDTQAREQEERRLLFVATSRARTRLTLTWCGRRNRFGKYEDAYRSPFLDGLDRLFAPVVFSARSGRPGFGYASGPSNVVSVSAARASGVVAGIVAPVGVSVDMSIFPVGTPVRHGTFGRGVILSVTGTSAKIRFSDKARTLALEYAKLVVES